MDNQDKIFEQFKEVAREAESKEFPAMDKIWSRVEDKLDYRAARKSAGIWKIIAIAATVLLLVALGYQLTSTREIKRETQNQTVNNPIQPAKEQNLPLQKATENLDIPLPINSQIAEKPNRIPVKALEKAHAVSISTKEFAAETAHKPSAASQIQPTTLTTPGFQTISGLVSANEGFLSGANVVVMGTTRGTHTDEEGKYIIDAKEGEKLIFSFDGLKDIVATVGDQNEINANLPEGKIMSGKKNAVKNKKFIRPGASTTIKGKSRFGESSGDLNSGATESELNNSISANIALVGNAPTLYIIDGKPATEEQFKQLKTDEIATMKLLSQSEAKSLYGNKAVNGAMVVSKKAAKNAEAEFRNDDASFENAFESPSAAPMSTFSLAVETGSYAEIRNFINKGKKVPANAVRIEEMINYFEYRYPQPDGQHPVSINTEYGSCPWNSKHKLLKVGIQGKNAAATIAKATKIQIEFNPAIVNGYRLIGFERRNLRPEDFNNGQHAGNIIGGQNITALYEIIPNGVDSQFFEQRDDVTFIKVNTGITFGGELANIKFGYEQIENGKPAAISKLVANKPEILQNSSDDFRFCAAVAWFGLKLRQSELIGNRSYSDLLKLAKGSVTAQSDGSRGEFIRLVEAVNNQK